MDKQGRIDLTRKSRELRSKLKISSDFLSEITSFAISFSNLEYLKSAGKAKLL